MRLKRFLGFQERKSVVNSLDQTLIIALLYGCLQVLTPLLKFRTSIKDHLHSCLTITQVRTKEYWKNPVNFPWTLKENIN